MEDISKLLNEVTLSLIPIFFFFSLYVTNKQGILKMLHQWFLETLFILVFPVYKFDHVFIVCMSPPLATETNRAAHILSNSVSLELKNVDQVFFGGLYIFLVGFRILSWQTILQ